MLSKFHESLHVFFGIIGLPQNFHTSFHKVLSITSTSDLTALLTMLVTLHLFVFCKRVYSIWTKLMLGTTFMICSMYEFHNYFWYKNISAFTNEDFVWTYMEGALLSGLLLLLTHIHILEMKRHYSILIEKKTRYMCHDYTEQTKNFGSDFLGLTCDYSSVKNFMAYKIIIIQVIAWALLVISLIGSIIARFGG